MPMSQIAHSTDFRACLLGRDGVEAHEHVRKAGGAEHEREGERDEVDLARGRLAVLQTRAEDLRARRTGLVHGALETLETLKPYLPSTQMVMTKAPMMSSVALTICTQVVPFMPPMST